MLALMADFLNPLSAKTPQSSGIGNMKCQVLIGERVKTHNHRRPQHLIGTHAIGPGLSLDNLSLVEVLQNIITNSRRTIDDHADDFQLYLLGMSGSGLNQRHLFLVFFAHFVFDLFLTIVVFLGTWINTLYYMW